MNKKQLIISLLALLSLSGCVTIPSEDKPIKNDSANVRVSGDVTVSAVDRNLF